MELSLPLNEQTLPPFVVDAYWDPPSRLLLLLIIIVVDLMPNDSCFPGCLITRMAIGSVDIGTVSSPPLLPSDISVVHASYTHHIRSDVVFYQVQMDSKRLAAVA